MGVSLDRKEYGGAEWESWTNKLTVGPPYLVGRDENNLALNECMDGGHFRLVVDNMYGDCTVSVPRVSNAVVILGEEERGSPFRVTRDDDKMSVPAGTCSGVVGMSLRLNL